MSNNPPWSTVLKGGRMLRGGGMMVGEGGKWLLYHFIQFGRHASQRPKCTKIFIPVTGHRGHVRKSPKCHEIEENGSKKNQNFAAAKVWWDNKPGGWWEANTAFQSFGKASHYGEGRRIGINKVSWIIWSILHRFSVAKVELRLLKISGGPSPVLRYVRIILGVTVPQAQVRTSKFGPLGHRSQRWRIEWNGTVYHTRRAWVAVHNSNTWP